MPVCQYCHKKWTWWETLKRTFFTVSFKGIPCPYCGERQFVSKKTTRRYGLLLFLIPLGLLLPLIGVPGIYMLVYLLVSGIFVIGIYPFILKLSKEEEFPF